jgi:uncharacterized protein (UPF0212 family)
MFDPELKYCPQCHDEYRAEIVRCAACGVELLTGSQMMNLAAGKQVQRERRADALSPADDLVAIHKAPLTDIRHLEGLLRQEQIPCLVAGDEKSCGKGCCPTNFFLQVRREDAMDAFRVIEAVHARNTALHHHDTSHSHGVFNADAGEATCPACGHKFPTAFTTCPDCGLCFG